MSIYRIETGRANAPDRKGLSDAVEASSLMFIKLSLLSGIWCFVNFCAKACNGFYIIECQKGGGGGGGAKKESIELTL